MEQNSMCGPSNPSKDLAAHLQSGGRSQEAARMFNTPTGQQGFRENQSFRAASATNPSRPSYYGATSDSDFGAYMSGSFGQPGPSIGQQGHHAHDVSLSKYSVSNDLGAAGYNGQFADWQAQNMPMNYLSANSPQQPGVGVQGPVHGQPGQPGQPGQSGTLNHEGAGFPQPGAFGPIQSPFSGQPAPHFAGGNFPPPSAFAPGQIPIPGPYGTFPPPGSFAPLQGHFLGQPGFPAPGQYQPNLHGQMSPSGLYDSGLSNPQVLSELVQNQPSSQESQADLYASGIHQQASPTVVTGQSSEHNGQNQLPQPQMGSAPQGQCLGLDTYRYATLAQAEADFDAELYAWMNGNAATEEPQANVQADRGSNVTDPTEPIGRDIDGLKKIIEGDRDALTAARRDVAAGNLTGLEAQALEVFEQNAEAETTAERDWVAQTIAERDLETLQLARLSLSDDASKIAEKALAGAMDESLLASQVERAQATSKGDKEQANEAEQAQTDSMRDSELAAVAGQLLANVEDNTSEKFKNSKFLELMRRLQSQEVVAHDNDFVEASSVPALAPRSGLAPTSSVGSHVTGSRTGPPLTLQQNPGQQASSPVTPKTVTVKDVDEGQDEK